MESIYAGFISGLFQTIIGHPLDTLKTWSQNGNSLKKPKLTINNLYKGIKYPLIQNPIAISSIFYSNYITKKYTNNEYVSGGVAGITSGIISTPLDKYKIMQQQNIQYVFNKKNFLQSYKNLPIMLIREIPACIIYFSSFQYMKEQNIPTFISGGIAGVASWFLTYPVDTIKSRMQSGSYRTIKEAYQQKYLYRGLNSCLARAFIVNSFGLYIYDKILFDI
tara:strand:+ start:379 stop:1041 length:663 start_codon:yes stop_codon:yes gene_type:complete